MKKIAVICISIICVICLVVVNYMSKNWTIRYKEEMNRFFGKGNWKYISEETEESNFYSEYVAVHSNPSLSREVPGKYKNWHISFKNRNGKEEVWKITDHPLKVNNHKYGIFSSKRYSSKQALYSELMDISFGIISEDIFNEIIRSELPEKEANCIEVSMSYHGGNPKPKFYDALAKEPWFTVNKITAENYLSCDLHDFYIDIRAHDYRLNKLTVQERQNVFDSLKAIEKKLLNKYGDNASFEIYFDKENKVEHR